MKTCVAALRRRPVTIRLAAIVAVLTLGLAACSSGGGGGGSNSGDNGGGGGGVTKMTVLEPINSPIIYPFRVAIAAGYYKAEGLDVDLKFVDGGGAVATQLIGGNVDVGVLPLGSTAQALSQGHTDLRAIYCITYGSLFSIAVKADSDIHTAADLKGKKIGITALSDGAVPIVRGILKEGGLSEHDATLTPLGDSTALEVRALKNDTVAAFGGSVNDMAALKAQGLNLRYLDPKTLANVCASSATVKSSYLSSHKKQLEGFARATAEGAYWGKVDPASVLKVLKKVTPEQFTSSKGEAIFDAVKSMPLNPSGPIGAQSADAWVKYFDFIGLKRPSTPLDQIVNTELIGPANTFDKQKIANDAKNYKP